EARDIARVDSGADHATALADVPERLGHEAAHGREDDCCVELLRRRFARSASPGTAERQRKGLTRRVAIASEGKDPAALPGDDLGQDVRGGAEAIETQPLAVAGELQRPIADQPGAQ